VPKKSLEKEKERIANILFKIDAFKFGIYKLSTGKSSPYYVDLQVIPSFPDAYHEICDYFTEAIKNQIGTENFDRIAGIPLTGIVFASQIAYNLNKPFLYIRKGVKHQGRERSVEGVLASGERVLIVDDLVNTGITIKKAAEAIRTEGGVVTSAISFLDREEGASKRLLEKGINLFSAIKISEVAKSLYDNGALDEENYKTIIKQVKKK
jgi:orotate phosphoribosyltransferase